MQLIQGLADYEHEPDAVQATHSKLLSTIAFATEKKALGAASVALPTTEPISPSRPARCILVVPNDDTRQEPVGMALYFYNYSTWRACPGIYLEDLFVAPSHRGKGYGKALLVQLAREVVQMKGGRLEWSVLKWNEPSIKFYESIGAKMMNEWVGMRVDGKALDELAAM